MVRQPCKRCFAYRSNRSVSFPIRWQCFACALTVTTKRGSRACVTRWLLALARIVLLLRPKRARVASRAYSSSRRLSTMRGVSLMRTLRLKAYRERRPLGPPLLPSSLVSPFPSNLATCLYRLCSSVSKVCFRSRLQKNYRKNQINDNMFKNWKYINRIMLFNFLNKK